MRSPAAHTDLDDGTAAADTGFSLSLVDPQESLKVPALAVHAAELLHGGAGAVDGLPKNVLNVPVEPLQLYSAQVAGSLQGMDPGAEQGLIGVDVAHAGQGRLIQEQWLDLSAAGSNLLAELLRRNLQRFWTELGDLRVCFQPSSFNYLHPTEPSLVSIAKLMMVVGQLKDQVGVLFERLV